MRSEIPLFLIAFFSLVLYVQSPGQERPELKSVEPENYSQSEIKSAFDPKDELCVPEYSTGCSMGDGFTDFAVEEIQNYGSGCEDLNGTGWSQYPELGPAVLLPGFSHDFIMQTGYDNQFVTIWIDFNDDFELTEDEKILIDFEMENAGELYTVNVEIPTSATPGMHYLRARTNWQSPASDPCENYSYGEAEDYYVVVGSAEYGAIQGFVTELGNGAAVEGATISLEGPYNFSTTTGDNGSYLIENVFTGEYEVTCFKQGYNIQDTLVTIEEDIIIDKNFQLTQPTIDISPQSIEIMLPPDIQHEEIVTIENSGNGMLNWSSSIQIQSGKSKDYFDLQFEYPASGGQGEAGIETDGEYIYTSRWNGAEFFKYDLDGNFIESFSIDGVSGIRDIAYDGTFFYGSPAIPVVSELDLANKELISTFNAPTPVRAIAYDESQDAFFANNWSSQVYKFDKSGNVLDIFGTGPVGENYYGFAYDMVSPGGPFLWGYAHTGESLNEIIQIQLPSGTETGFTQDITELLSGPVYNMAGGLFTHPNLIFGKWSLGGIVQNDWIWAVDLGDAQTWVWTQPNTGTLEPAETEEITVQIETFELLPGDYQAEIVFTSYPEVGDPVVELLLTVAEDVNLPCNLITDFSCTDVILTWSKCPLGAPQPDSFRIYRNDNPISFSLDTTFTDTLLLPETIYNYKVSAFYDGNETSTTSVQEITIPLPEDLQPLNPTISINGTNATLVWDLPSGCLLPDGFNVYRDNELLGFTPDTSFQINWGIHTYCITAVYYFGESEPSESIVMTSVRESSKRRLSIFPNPANDYVNINSGSVIEQIELHTLEGDIVSQDYIGTKNYTLRCSGLKPGIYIITVKCPDKIYRRKLIIR